MDEQLIDVGALPADRDAIVGDKSEADGAGNDGEADDSADESDTAPLHMLDGVGVEDEDEDDEDDVDLEDDEDDEEVGGRY